jgi:hypothetical protein
MAKVFPAGLKPDTGRYWRGNDDLVKRKITYFIDRYKISDLNKILLATNRYVNDFEEESLMDMQINLEPEIIDENLTKNDPENYPVYDKTNEINNNGIENIMVFTKDGDK